MSDDKLIVPETPKIIHMTEAQLQLMLQNAFQASVPKMRDYVDAKTLRMATTDWVKDYIIQFSNWQCNENLIDNWCYNNPINQRNKTLYDSGCRYVIDEHITNAGITVELKDGYITVSNDLPENTRWFCQNGEFSLLKQLQGEIITLSLLYRTTAPGITFGAGAYYKNPVEQMITDREYATLVADGNINLATLTFKMPEFIDGSKEFYYWNKFAVAMNPGDKVDLFGVKLEVGPYSTLAHKEGDVWVFNGPTPNRALELLKCQRFQFSPVYTASWWGVVGIGACDYRGCLQINVPLPVQLRTHPSVIFTGIWDIRGNGSYIEFDASEHAISSSQISDNFASLDIMGIEGIEPNHVYQLTRHANGDAQLLFDANL